VTFRPSIGFTRLDGWAALALLLENRSDVKAWTEEVEIVLMLRLAWWKPSTERLEDHSAGIPA
jgi:hypothetical protein